MWNQKQARWLQNELTSTLVIALTITLGVATHPSESFAFPEMVRHGYQNCTACHISTNGGGILTQYGRALSREVMSSWGQEGEENFLYGAIPPVNWLALGGDVQTLNITQQDRAPQSRFILMHADLEAAVNVGQFTATGTLGLLDSAIFPEGNHLISRRHYLRYHPTDELFFRAGRFNQAFGINTAEHAMVTKRSLGWDEGSESYNLEGSWIGEKVNVYVTGNFGRLDSPKLNRDVGVTGSLAYAAAEKIKIGSSYYYGTNDFARRNILGGWGIVGFTKKIVLLGEYDLQRYFAATAIDPQWGSVDYLKLDGEVLRGLHVFATQEYAQLNFLDSNTQTYVYGIGTQFFPRPHFDFQLVFQTRDNVGTGLGFKNWVFFLLHYYL